MKKALLVMAMVIALAMSTMAGAFAAGHNNGVRCSVSGPLEDADPGNIVDNPAEMFEYFGDRGNPVDAIGESDTGWTVGEWIRNRCAAGNS